MNWIWGIHENILNIWVGIWSGRLVTLYIIGRASHYCTVIMSIFYISMYTSCLRFVHLIFEELMAIFWQITLNKGIVLCNHITYLIQLHPNFQSTLYLNNVHLPFLFLPIDFRRTYDPVYTKITVFKGNNSLLWAPTPLLPFNPIQSSTVITSSISPLGSGPLILQRLDSCV